MEVVVKGLDGVARSLTEAIKYIEKDIQADLQDWGNDTVKIARNIHDFGRPYSKGYRGTGNGDRSIKSEVKGTQVRLYIDPDLVSVDSKKYGKFNYIWAQHDGTKRNGKVVIKANPFLIDAVKENEDELEKKIQNTLTRILG